MRTSLVLIVFLNMVYAAKAQYLDVPGAATRALEKNAVSQRAKETKKVTAAFLRTVPVTLSEQYSRTYPALMDPDAVYIDYSVYAGMCKNYLNPFKRQACSNRLSYLLEAHRLVLGLHRTMTLNKIDKGVKELMGEKYVRITNRIFMELENLKYEAESDSFFGILWNKS